MAEQKGVGPWPKFLEGKIGRGKHGTANMVRGIIQCMNQPSLCQAQFQCAELPWKKLDNINSLWRGNEDTVDSVDDTVGSELSISVQSIWLALREDLQC